MSMGQSCGGQFPGPQPTQGTIGSPSTYSPASPTMFHESYVPGVSRFTPSPPEYDAAMHEALLGKRLPVAHVFLLPVAHGSALRVPRHW
jgi:hypothetical protein